MNFERSLIVQFGECQIIAGDNVMEMLTDRITGIIFKKQLISIKHTFKNYNDKLQHIMINEPKDKQELKTLNRILLIKYKLKLNAKEENVE